jgi:hypothetical protein
MIPLGGQEAHAANQPQRSPFSGSSPERWDWVHGDPPRRLHARVDASDGGWRWVVWDQRRPGRARAARPLGWSARRSRTWCWGVDLRATSYGRGLGVARLDAPYGHYCRRAGKRSTIPAEIVLLACGLPGLAQPVLVQPVPDSRRRAGTGWRPAGSAPPGSCAGRRTRGCGRGRAGAAAGGRRRRSRP